MDAILEVSFIFSKISLSYLDFQKLRMNFSYKKEYWVKRVYCKERVVYDAYIIDKKGYFLSGFLSKILAYLVKNDIPYKVNLIDVDFVNLIPQDPKLSIDFREDQKNLIELSLKYKRGVIKSPTGSGKTIVACGIISAFPNNKILFLCHNVSLIKQAIAEFKKFGLGPVSQVGNGVKDLSGRIVVATIQSLIKIDSEDYNFDIVLIDECHHVSSFSSTYYKLLTCLNSSIKIGFTATLPIGDERLLAMEGLIGPLIGEVTLNQAVENGILAIPKVKLLSIPQYININDLKTYQSIYNMAIVNYRKRNRIIVDEANRLNKENKSCIIYINNIEHGENIQKICNLLNLKTFFVKGDVDGDVREKIKDQLNKKEIMTVISTVVFKEGINIPELDAVIIAGGGKSELVLIQTIGRGMRRTKIKSDFLIIDCLDMGKYLSEHAIQRVSVYLENGWI